MTLLSEEKQKIFFNKVKGGKIRYNDWCVGEYFIPETLDITSGIMRGMQCKGSDSIPDYWWVNNGFQVASNGEQWEYYAGDIHPDMSILPDMTIDTKLGFFDVGGGYDLGLIRGSGEPLKAQPVQCSCPLEMIMQTGCTCGGV